MSASSTLAVSAPSSRDGDDLRDWALGAYAKVRGETEHRASFLSDEDQLIQSMPDTSPAKWHRAHTTWFFEQFLLAPNVPGYRPFDERFAFLFNSYYVSAGPRHERPRRGLITRPTVAEVGAYRAHVDQAVTGFLKSADVDTLGRLAPLIEIGLNHEQQHQELMLTDILHGFAHNPTDPVYDASWQLPSATRHKPIAVPAGIYRIGHQGQGFSFDNESPNHQVLIQQVNIGPLVTNGEWLAFMEAGGYQDPLLWLMDGWATVAREGWEAPGYWRNVDGRWFQMTLAGMQPIDLDAAVCHVSYYEADAFARFSGKDLPTEQEWEIAAARGGLPDALGTVWQWTRSAYSAYPGYRPVPGALGEYNGKFMVNQFVLRGSSVATPDGHARLTYRNFFYPHHRWQFTGLRLSEYASGLARDDGPIEEASA